jgi:hypothetical protein
MTTQLVCISSVGSYSYGDVVNDPTTITSLMADKNTAAHFKSVVVGGRTPGTWPKLITADYTLTAEDSVDMLLAVKATTADINITIPSDDAAAIPVGTRIEMIKLGAWAINPVAASGVTMTGTPPDNPTLRKIGFNSWFAS